MSNLAITAANVVSDANPTIDRAHLAGEAVTAGQQVYFDTTAKKWMLADNNDANAAKHHANGTALNGAALNQPLAVQSGGDIVIGGALTAGARYYLSTTAGAIEPETDLASGQAVCLVGIAKSATVLSLDYNFPGVTL